MLVVKVNASFEGWSNSTVVKVVMGMKDGKDLVNVGTIVEVVKVGSVCKCWYWLLGIGCEIFWEKL